MNVDLFDFDLPRSFIADRPANPRDASRLLDITGESFRDRSVGLISCKGEKEQ